MGYGDGFLVLSVPGIDEIVGREICREWGK